MPNTRQIYRQAIEGEINPADLNRDGVISPWELFVSTCLASLCIGISLGALALIVWAWTAGRSPALKVIMTGVALPLFTGGIIGTWRQFHYEMMLGWAKEDRRRRQQREDEDRVRIYGPIEAEATSRFSQADVDAGARMYLQRYYQGKGLARTAWEADGLSKDLWDHVNSLMIERHIRRGRHNELAFATFAEAWGVYCDGKLSNRRWLNNDGELLERE